MKLKTFKTIPYSKTFSIKEKELKKQNSIKIKTEPKKALTQALKLLNTAFTLNKNVKKKAYKEEKLDYCGRCDSSYEEAQKAHFSCPESDWADCYFASTIVDYTLRDSEYSQKTKIIKKVINLIKNNLLPIKYGKNENIVYFEYCGRQISFHDPKNQINNVKKFNGVWNGIPNKKIPFDWIAR